MDKTTEETQFEIRTLPVLATRGLVVFPKMLIQIDVARQKSILAVKEAMEGDREIFLVAQYDLSEQDPKGEELFKVGVIAKVKQVITGRDNILKVHLEGMKRAEIVGVVNEKPYIKADVLVCEDQPYNNTPRTQALIRVAREKFEEYIGWFRNVPPDILINVMKEKNCGVLADFIASNISLDYTQKQYIIDEIDSIKRLERLCDVLAEEIKIIKVETEITRKTQSQMDEHQREYILREQLKIISNELGEESTSETADELKEKIKALKLSEDNEKKLLTECDRLQKLHSSSQEASLIKVYLDFCLDLPWNKVSKEKLDVKKAEKVLNKDHYGIEKVKERFLELFAVRKLNGGIPNAQVICLVGPPGVGKTSVAKSIAQAMGRKYARVSLGGISDVADIMGHRKTYVGAMCGRIMAAIKQTGTRNPLILLDEIDKLGQSFKGDPSSSLLEVLDPEQNKAFHDHYVDMPFDLSQVLFITTANDPSTIPSALYDRMDVITLSSYTAEEKYQIASRHLIPKQLKLHSIEKSQMKFPASVLRFLIENYTKEAGVRSLERNIATLCRKVAKIIVTDEEFKSIKLTEKDIEKFLGSPKYSRDNVPNSDEIGLVNGLAWTSVGGELLPIEVAVMDGTGKIQLTGSLGDVMKESASAAITCIRTMADKLDINSDFYAKKDIHIHAPEGAIPKDGPSAGVAMAVAITSALKDVKINHKVAMTGEITLQGRVLAIGGLKEKSMAAYKNGMKKVLIPMDNKANLEEVDEIVKKSVEFIPIKHVSQALEIALVDIL